MGMTGNSIKILPVCMFTRNRTGCAVATAEALLSNLSCSGRALRYVLCDDRSVPGHVDAVVDVFRRHGVEPSVHLNDDGRWGLGASMNRGLEDAFSDSDLCLRIEDDWLLKRHLDVGPWCDAMGPMRVGSVRMGMMFRRPDELVKAGCGLLYVKSRRKQNYTFNNQVAIVSKELWLALGKYLENVHPQRAERDMADRYNALTDRGWRPPHVCWPEGWNTMTQYGEGMAFDHVGRSIVGHSDVIPRRYNGLNDPVSDSRIRAGLSGGVSPSRTTTIRTIP